MNNKRLKRGVISVAITAGVLAAVILFNIVFSLLSIRFLWVIDTTPNELIRISDYSKELLDGVDEDQNNITIYFLAAPDELENYELMGHTVGESDSTWGMSYIYNLAKLYEKEYSFISVKLLDASDDADYIREHFAMSIGTSLGPLNIIMENHSDGLPTYRTMQRDEFFTFGTDILYFRGDDKLTSTILSLAGENPIAYFVGGHGEDIGDLNDGENFGKASALVELFREAGYVVEKIDLSERDFAVEDEDDAFYGRSGVVVIYGPDVDFKTDADGGVNEITRLRKYLNRKNHNLMVFMDPETEDMPNLDEYLYDYWGVAFDDNIVSVDTRNPLESGAVTDDGYNYYARYETDTQSPGSALTSSLLSLENLPLSFFGASRTITMNTKWSTINEPYMVSEGMTTYKLGATFYVPALSVALGENGSYRVYDTDLYEEYRAKYEQAIRDEKLALYIEKYYQKAYDQHLKGYREEYENQGLTEAEIDAKCKEYAEKYVEKRMLDENLQLCESDPAAVMTLTHAKWMYKVGESVPAYALACGSTDYASGEALENASFSNRDTLYSAIYLFGKSVLPYDIDIIEIESESSLAISESMAVVWTVVLAVLFPIGVLTACIVVMRKRRRHN